MGRRPVWLAAGCSDKRAALGAAGHARGLVETERGCMCFPARSRGLNSLIDVDGGMLLAAEGWCVVWSNTELATPLTDLLAAVRSSLSLEYWSGGGCLVVLSFQVL